MSPPPAATSATTHRPQRIRGARPLSSQAAARRARAFEPTFWPRVRLALDAVVLLLAAAAALFGASASSLHIGWEDRVAAVAFPIVVLVLLHAREGANTRISGGVIDALAQLLGIVSLAAMLVIALDSILGASHPVPVALRLWVFSLFYLFVARVALRSVRAEMLRGRWRGTRTLIVGGGVVGERLARRMLENPGYGLAPVGLFDPDPLPRIDALRDSVPLLDGSEGLLGAIARTSAQQVIVAFSSEPDAALIDALQTCRRLGIEVAMVPRMYELVNERSALDHIGGVPLVSLRPTNPHGWKFAVKHAIDTGLAALALVVLSPLLAAIAIGVRISSPGPVLFRQRRVGRDGREFELLKFRTMTSAR